MDQSQVEALESKHAELEALIDEEEHRPHPESAGADVNHGAAGEIQAS